VQYTSLFAGAKPAGICTKTCTPDDPKTTMVDEDSCPKSSSVCATFTVGSVTVNYCLLKCKPSMTKNPCPASSKQTCHPLSTIYTRRPEAAACLYPACTVSRDCPAYSSTSCYADADCKAVATDAFCESVSGVCGRPGYCSKAGLCGPHGYGKAAAKVGDPCKDDFDCPHNGVCMKEQRSASGAIGTHYRNGYCTIPFCSFANQLTGYLCPTESVCHWGFYGGLCFKTCKLDASPTCRGNSGDSGGDYECYAWNRWQFGSGAKVTAEPVCMSAAVQKCDSLPTGYTCSSLGDDTNSTKMSCADRTTGLSKASSTDPTGVCLDKTASGKFTKPLVDAGPDASRDSGQPDSGAPDGGPVDSGLPGS